MDATNWISVKDRCPTRGTQVLAWFGNAYKPYIIVTRYDGVSYFFRKQLPPGIDISPKQCVTHWLPFPDPPGQRVMSVSILTEKKLIPSSAGIEVVKKNNVRV